MKHARCHTEKGEREKIDKRAKKVVFLSLYGFQVRAHNGLNNSSLISNRDRFVGGAATTAQPPRNRPSIRLRKRVQGDGILHGVEPHTVSGGDRLSDEQKANINHCAARARRRWPEAAAANIARGIQ